MCHGNCTLRAQKRRQGSGYEGDGAKTFAVIIVQYYKSGGQVFQEWGGYLDGPQNMACRSIFQATSSSSFQPSTLWSRVMTTTTGSRLRRDSALWPSRNLIWTLPNWPGENNIVERLVFDCPHTETFHDRKSRPTMGRRTWEGCVSVLTPYVICAMFL